MHFSTAPPASSPKCSVRKSPLYPWTGPRNSDSEAGSEEPGVTRQHPEGSRACGCAGNCSCCPRSRLGKGKKGQGCARRPRQDPVSPTGLQGRVAPPRLQFYGRRDSSHRPHSLITLGDPFPPLLEALLAERLEGGAESSDPVPSPRPKAFALRAPTANLHTCAPTRMCTRTHVRPEFSPRLSSELALSAAHHLRGKVAPC